MSEEFDSYLAAIGFRLAKKEIDIDRAMQMLSDPKVVSHLDGSNVQQLIRVSLMMSRVDPDSIMLAEVGSLICIIKPDLEIDFGLQVGVANAQSCALFAMHSIALQRGLLEAALVTLQHMLKTISDVKGRLEVLCWLGVLHQDANEHQKAAGAFLLALEFLLDPEVEDALTDNSALDMVRMDNQNIFSFPTLSFFSSGRAADITTSIRDLLGASMEKGRQ
jgi:hypothetical protein